MRRLALTIALLAAAGGRGESTVAEKPLQEELVRIPAKEPADALKTFRIRHGFQMELVAHEPTVVDPIAGVFDAAGRLYVIEMRDYPFERPKGQELGRVRLLQDVDGDGRYEKSTIFAEGLEIGRAHV